MRFCCSAWEISTSCSTMTPKRAARVLNLALTSREKGENAVPMAGFPYHQLEAYLAKLIAAGLRVAICDQVEDPRQAKGLVKRELTRIVSRGTVTDDALLDPRENNFLAALVPGETAGLAWVELSTGRFHAAQLPAEQLSDELRASRRSNACWPKTTNPRAPLADGMLIMRGPTGPLPSTQPRKRLARHFGTAHARRVRLHEHDSAAIRAAGASSSIWPRRKKPRSAISTA